METDETTAVDRGEDGTIVLKPGTVKKLLKSHVDILDAMPDIDANLIKIAKQDGDPHAALAAARLLKQSVGLMPKDAAPNKPGIPELDGMPTGDLLKELERRKESAKPVEVTVKAVREKKPKPQSSASSASC